MTNAVLLCIATTSPPLPSLALTYGPQVRQREVTLEGLQTGVWEAGKVQLEMAQGQRPCLLLASTSCMSAPRLSASFRTRLGGSLVVAKRPARRNAYMDFHTQAHLQHVSPRRLPVQHQSYHQRGLYTFTHQFPHTP